MQAEKFCRGCKQTLPAASWYVIRAKGKAWLSALCRTCTKAHLKNYRRENPHVQARDRARGKRQGPEYDREYRARFPEKYRAHYAVSNAKRAGRLKPQPCVDCGTEQTEAHHEDYSKPLDVIWLCSLCHRRRHYAA